jgi:hypothetical protein
MNSPVKRRSITAKTASHVNGVQMIVVKDVLAEKIRIPNRKKANETGP